MLPVTFENLPYVIFHIIQLFRLIDWNPVQGVGVSKAKYKYKFVQNNKNIGTHTTSNTKHRKMLQSINNINIFQFRLFKEGSPLKFSKHDFKIAVDLVGQLFGRVWSPQTIRGAHGDQPHFPAKSGPENQKWKIRIITRISHHQSINNSPLSSHKNFQPNWPKNSWVVAKKRLPKYGPNQLKLVSAKNIHVWPSYGQKWHACPYLGIRFWP